MRDTAPSPIAAAALAPPSARPVGNPGLPTIALLLCGFVAAWTAYGAISGAPVPLHSDMTEAYVWGREFQLGYNQHPPFWAWIAGAWFLLFPRADWAFDLLAMINAAIGLLGAWVLAGNFASGYRRHAAALLLLLTPFFTFLAFKFNANSIFLSLCPWLFHFFVRSVETRRPGDAISFGVVMGLAMLSKYFALLLAASCLIAALTHPSRRRYFGSAAPYLSIAVAAALFAPHAWWLWTSNAPPVRYFLGTTGHSFIFASGHAAQALIGAVAFETLVAAAILLGLRSAPGGWIATARRKWREPPFRLLVILAIMPLLLAILSGLAFRLDLSNNMLIGVFSLVPLLLIEIADGRYGGRADRRLFLIAISGAVGMTALMLLLSPVIAIAQIGWSGNTDRLKPSRELARAATEAWHQTVDTPLLYVAGSAPYGDAIAFYSADRPHTLFRFSFAAAPWVTRTDIARHGLLVACLVSDAVCLDKATALARPRTIRRAITLTHAYRGHKGRPTRFILVIVPPRDTAR
jgi:4-amino-4-deoxy-L-arabinose transferase-like glycosyltransferase